VLVFEAEGFNFQKKWIWYPANNSRGNPL